MNKKNKKQIKTQNKSTYLCLLPVLLCAAIIPTIVFLKEVPVTENIKAFWPQRINYDFFSFYKILYLNILAGCAISCWLIKDFCIEKKSKFILKAKKYNILFLAFSLFVILSTVFSEYKNIALYGYPDRYEGMFTWLSYAIFFFVTTQLFTKKENRKLLQKALFFSGIIVSLIGAFQFFELDIFQTYQGRKMILPIERYNLIDVLKFNFPKHQIYSTLFNTNNVGSFIALFFPFTILMFLNEFKIKIKIVYGVLSLLFFINFLGCRSRAGYLGVIISVVISSIIYLISVFYLKKNREKDFSKKMKTNILWSSFLIILFFLIFTLMNKVSDGALSGQVNRLKQEALTINTRSKNIRLKDILLEGNKVSLVFDDLFLIIAFEDKSFYFYDENYDRIIYTIDNEYVLLHDVRYQDVSVRYIINQALFRIKIQKYSFDIVYNNRFYLNGSQGLLSQLRDIDKKFFAGKEHLATKRGYIWSRTIPVLKTSLMYGKGADTFPLYFPQDDYVGKILAYGHSNILIDKPHNMYLQIALNTGLLSLIIFIIIIILYFFDSLKSIYLSNNYIVLGYMSSILAFLIAGVFNDSLVSVTPIFFLFLALAVIENNTEKNSFL